MRCRLHWLLSVAGLLAGCQPSAQKSVPASLPLTGQTVEVIVPASLGLKDQWEPLLQEWRAQTGGDISWDEVEDDFFSRRLHLETHEKANGGRLILLGIGEVADAAATGWLTPFPPAVANVIDNKDIFAGLKDAALSREKKLVAAPVSAPVMLCYYRKDLLDTAGLKPPRTWNEYQQLLEQLPRWAPGLAALEPCGPEFRASLFLARSTAFARHPQNYSVWFDIQTGEPLFGSPAFERALDTARSAWKQMPNEIWQLSAADCRRELLAGRAAMVLCYEPSSAYPQTASNAPPAAETPLPIGVTQLPGSTSVYQSGAKRWETTSEVHQPGLVGFSGLVMAVHADDDRAAAWNLLQTLIERIDVAFAERPRSICWESEANTLLLDTSEFTPETTSQIADATAETLRRRDVTFDLAIPGASLIRQAISAELAAAQDESKSTAEILAAIQQRVATMTASRRVPLRDDYRRSVGLGPVN